MGLGYRQNDEGEAWAQNVPDKTNIRLLQCMVQIAKGQIGDEEKALKKVLTMVYFNRLNIETLELIYRGACLEDKYEKETA